MVKSWSSDPSGETRCTTMVMSGDCFFVVTPMRCTSGGRMGIAIATRFCTNTWAVSRLVPSLKVILSVRVAGATAYRAALIEDKVISSQQGLKYAFVVKPDNTIERRTLETASTFE